MNLGTVIEDIFGKLADSLEQLSDSQYNTPCKNLSKATIGQHVRHIIDLFQCLQSGYEASLVNYEKRKRDVCIETDKSLATLRLQEILINLKSVNKELNIEAALGSETDFIVVSSNYFRELLYNIEHTIHHMALIRVGIYEATDLTLPESYGVAPSTLQYREACAQ